MLTVRLLEIAKNNGYSSYDYGRRQQEYILRQQRQHKSTTCDRINFLGRQREKNMNIELMQELIYPIVGVLHDVRTELGPGLNESVYQEGLELELQAQNIPYEREKTINPTYRGIAMEAIFRMDFVCVKNIIVECKAVNKLNADHRAQLFNYMRLTKLRMGILVNFAPVYMEIERYFYDPNTNSILTYKGEKLKGIEVNTVFDE